MERLTTYAGWLLGMVALAASILLYAELQNVRQQLANESTRLERQKQARGAGMSSKLDKAKARIAELEEELGALRTAKDEAPNKEAEQAAEVAVDPSVLLQGMLAGAEKGATPANEEDASEPGNTFGKMLEGEHGERMLDASSDMQINMSYRDFFAGLALDPEREEAVREVLRRFMRKTARTGMRAMGGGGDMDALSEEMAVAEEAMRAELAEILTPEELAYFDEYQATLPARQMAMGMEMQLNMMAPDLTAENRQLMVDLMVEEMLAQQPEQAGNAFSMMPQDAMEMQHQAYTRLLERAAQYMESDQYAIAEGFIQQQQETTSVFMEAVQQQQGEKESGGTAGP